MSEPVTQESAGLRLSQSDTVETAGTDRNEPGISEQLVQQLADRIWALIKKDLEIEQERLRSGRGPQPWLRGGR